VCLDFGLGEETEGTSQSEDDVQWEVFFLELSLYGLTSNLLKQKIYMEFAETDDLGHFFRKGGEVGCLLTGWKPSLNVTR